MFAYCLNNPIRLGDSTGMRAVDICVAQHLGDGGGGIQRGEQGFSSQDYIADILDAKGITYYKDKMVIKSDLMDGNGMSYGAIFLASNITSENPGGENLLKHEYGHTVQMQEMGILGYTAYVAIPSVISFGLDSAELLQCEYYSLPQEYGADIRGGVQGRQYDSWAPMTYFIY